MSAIKEWFGIYNMIFRHIKNIFGDDELDEYIKYIADTAYDDVSIEFERTGIKGIRDRYQSNFKKDGGEVSSEVMEAQVKIDIDVCPAYKYMLDSNNPFDKPEKNFCDYCIKLNSQIISNAGCKLVVTDCDKNGKCKWTVKN